jgi:hypothetical protein
MKSRVIILPRRKSAGRVRRTKHCQILSFARPAYRLGTGDGLNPFPAGRGCVAFLGQHYFAGNGADFLVVLKLENVCRTNK